MPIFYAIAAMSQNRVIGKQGKIPWNIPEDFRWFKRKTMGGTLVMGRKTFEGIGEILPGRTTVVISRSCTTEGVANCRDLTLLDAILTTSPAPYWICGGEEIYEQFLEKCAVLYLTQVKRTVPGDTFFPPFEALFKLNQIIHETPEFRVERWLNTGEAGRLVHEPPPDEWPFTTR